MEGERERDREREIEGEMERDRDREIEREGDNHFVAYFLNRYIASTVKLPASTVKIACTEIFPL